MFTRNRKRQKKIAIFIAALMIAAIVFGAFAPFIYGGELNGTDKNITIEGQVGFEQKYKIRGYTPFFIQLKNMGKDFQGELQIKVLQKMERNQEQYILYTKPVELPENSSKQLEMSIPLPMMQKTFTISIVESKGKEVASKIIYADPQPFERVFVGVLSEQVEDMNYFKSLRIQMTGEEDEMLLGDGLIQLKKETFPEEYEVLQNFDMIVINNFDTSVLTEKQINALRLWNENGGTMVLGLGPNSRKILKSFQNLVDTKSQGGYKEENNLTPLVEFSNSLFADGESMYLSTVELKDSISIISSETAPYVSLVEQGQGKILVFHFDLGLAPFLDWPGNIEFLTAMYRTYSPAFKMSQEQREYMQYQYINPYSLRYIPSQNDQLYKWILIIITVYILLVGPILYKLLKRRNKREKAWVMIPVISVSTFAVIYLLSLQMGYTEVIGSSTALVELQEGGGSAKVHIGAGFFNPQKGELNIKFPAEMNAVVGMDSIDYYRREIGQDTIMAKVEVGEEPSIIFYPLKSWDFNYIQGEMIEKLPEKSLDSQLMIEEDYLKGTITNHLGYDLEDAVLAIGNTSYEKIDTIRDGETKQIQIQIIDGNQDRYQMINSLFGDINNRNVFLERMKSGESKEKLQRKVKRRQIFENYLNNDRKTYTMVGPGNNLVMDNFTVALYGFNSKNYIEGLQVNNKQVDTFSENMIIAPLQLDFAQKTQVEIPYGFIQPFYISGNGTYGLDDYNQTVFVKQGGNLNIAYKIETNIEVTDFQIKWETVSHSSPIEESLIYNNHTKQWESLKDSAYHMTEPYISKDHVIQTRFVVKDGFEMKYPRIRVGGMSK